MATPFSSRERQIKLLDLVGQTGLNSLFPDDFELYMIAFELVDSLDNTLEYFSFPIMPNNITINETEITNIKKTNGGVVSLKTDSFIPKTISLSGNFGRNLKLLIRDKLVDFKAFKSGLHFTAADFDGLEIKTGYGTTKVFQNILEGSKALDSKGNPTKLYFYNFAFNENYIVEVMDKSFTQSRDSSNIIWNYNVNLKAVAPINNTIIGSTSLFNLLNPNSLQKGINILASNITKSFIGTV